ncbi:MAG: caspase family protein [Marinosulfonomonas sp.]
MRAFLSSICLCLCLGTGPALASQTYGLVVGIDEYDNIPDLDGAVNDANDIADAMRGLDVTVTKLVDEQATRAAFLSNWRSIAAKMKDGDQLIVTYAGHGSNEPEHFKGNEEDGRDETLLLAGFSPFGQAAGERIRDDEIAELIALTPGRNVIFVADACHSGTVARTINPVLGYRYFSNGKIADDPLPPPPPNTLKNDGDDDVALFLAAVGEADKVPEFMIEGQARGALSYAFAESLRGKADKDQNGALTKSEVEEYVRRRVRGISQGIQSPQVQHRGSGDDVILSVAAVAPTQPAADGKTALSQIDPNTPVSVYWESAAVALPPNTVESPTAEAADLRINSSTGVVLTSAGDRVATFGDGEMRDAPERLAAVIDKYRLAQHLQGLVGNGALEMLFEDGDRNYFDGDPITIQVAGRSTRYVTLFNISSNGELAFLYPLHLAANGFDDPLESPATDRLNLGFQISAPYGADHVVAIETEHNPAVLRRVLSSYDGSTDSRQIWDQLSAAIQGMPSTPNVAIFPFFSSER